MGAYYPGGGGLSQAQVQALIDASILADVPAIAEVEAQGVFTDRIRTAVKSADQTINNSIALTNATDLVIPVDANTQYMVECCLFYQGTTVADINIDFVIPAGASFIYSSDALGPGTTTLSATVLRAAVTNTAQASGCMNSNIEMQPCGQLDVTGTGGTIQLRFAQANIEVSDLILRANSWMRVIEIV